MFAKQQVKACARILSSASSLRCATQALAARAIAMPRNQAFFSTEATSKAKAEEIQKKVKEASEKVKKDRVKEAKEVKAAKQKPEEEVKVVKKEECFTTVKSADGEEMTIQTKPVDSKGKVPVEEKVVKLVDEVLALNFVQIGQFMKVMKERLGLPDVVAAPVAATPGAGAAPAAGGAAAPAEVKKEEKKEKKTANVKLVKYDAKDKIKIIKEVRGLLGLGLKESKTMVESVPVVLKENMPKKDAEALVAKLKELGAEVALE
ncbi:hypothetical protein WA538_001044 [Blastocystis sp. DL]